jgi:hypothetical protein
MTTKTLEKVANGNSAVAGVDIDYAAVLKTLKLDPREPAVQALVLVCQQYELDPVLKHMILIQGSPYVTHKGLWHIAHRSELLNGEDIVAQGETSTEWWATVAIYRKDWTNPITMTGRYAKSGTNKLYGPEMAVTRAECLVLRRMFDVSLPVQEERDWEREQEIAQGQSAKRSAPKALDAPKPPAGMDPTTGEKPQSTRRPPPNRNSAVEEPPAEAPPFDAAKFAEGFAKHCQAKEVEPDLAAAIVGYATRDAEGKERTRDPLAVTALESAAVGAAFKKFLSDGLHVEVGEDGTISLSPEPF